MSSTYCNPLPLPDYPRGAFTRRASDYGWRRPARHDFRETADPSVLYWQGRWYLYPSCGMAWVSEDFVTWQHHRLEPYDIGYAPTLLAYRGRFYLTASEHAPLYVADDPLGPFALVGPMLLPDGRAVADWMDPMLFADDDGAVYAYWGCGGEGIRGAPLDPDHLNRLTAEPRLLFGFDPEHAWERLGDWNEDPSQSWVEGPWMLKHHGTYYLTYCAPGTEWRSYAMGAYTSRQPLGPFAYPPRNPILRDTEGLVQGPGHGCIVRGPHDTLWAFYTCLVKNHHDFERRVGMDPAGFDEQGNLYVAGASEWPAWAPGALAHPEAGNGAGLSSVTDGKHTRRSSERDGHWADDCLDNSMRTWWEPEPADAAPWVEVNLQAHFRVSACRILWAEPNLDYRTGVLPGPCRYVVEASQEASGDAWVLILDRSGNTEDLLIDYRTFPPVSAHRLRLRVLGMPDGMRVGVIAWTVFGKPALRGQVVRPRNPLEAS